MAGLREQWRRSAMQTIQNCALDLFDERGFAAVTIEEVANAAGVSPSSVYRYFGTKEGLVVADEFDVMSPAALGEVLDPGDPVTSLVRLVRDYEEGDGLVGRSTDDRAPAQSNMSTEVEARRRVRYFFTEPSIRAAVLSTLDRAAQRIAPLLEGDRLNATQARVAANALAFGYFAALERWFDDGGERGIASYVEDGLEPFRRA